YARPVTAYAADFIGAANLVNVDKVDAADGGAQVSVHGGQVHVAQKPLAGNVKLAARPEHISLSPRGSDDKRGVPGQVIYRRYLGFKATYAVRLGDQQVVNVDVYSAADPVYADGTPVTVRFEHGCRLVEA